MARQIAELRAKKNGIVTEARAVMDGITDDMTPEARVAENIKFDAMMAEADQIGADIRRLEALESEERALNEVAERRAGRENMSTDQAHEMGEAEERAFDTFMRHGVAGLDEEQRAVFAEMQTRALGSGTTGGQTGGFIIPPNFIARMEEAKKAYGGVRPLATVIKTEGGQPLTLPTADDTAEEGENLDENAAANEGDISFGNQEVPTYMYHSKIIKVPVQLLEDSFFSLEGYLPRKLVERIARFESRHYAVGTGVNQPKGFMTGIDVVDTAASGVLTWEDLIEIMHAIDPSRRGVSGWALSDSALKVVRKMKDGEGKPIWVESTRAGDPSTIFGKPYSIVNEMATAAAGNTPIAFGDFKSYIIRDAGTPTMQRLVERYAENLQVGFHAFERHGGFLLDAGDKPVKGLRIQA